MATPSLTSDMNAIEASTLRASLTHGVCTLTLNRPEVRNAMSQAMIGELVHALRQAEADPAVRVLVLRGAGGHFCAGGDIGDMAQARARLASLPPSMAASDPASREHPVTALNAAFGHLCLAFARSPLPVVAVLEGAVMGGGFGLACVADVTLAAASVRFRLPETSLGLVPAQIAPFLVERLGHAEAKRLALTGATVAGPEALTLRLVHELHPDAAALDAALARTLGQILACGPQATAHTKALLARARLAPAEQLIDEAATLFARAVLSDEGQEGTMAFVHKRPPSWAPKV